MMRCSLFLLVAMPLAMGYARGPKPRQHLVGTPVSIPTPVSTPVSESVTHNDSLKAAWNLRVGQELERVEAFDDALFFYKKVLDSPDPQLQQRALRFVTELLSKKQSSKRVDDPKASYLSLGGVWRDQGKVDEAIAVYEKALEANNANARADASIELAKLIKTKTHWSQQYAIDPILRFIRSKPIILLMLTIFGAVIVRWCLPRTNLLLTPNSSVPDLQWLYILIYDYDRQLTQSHSLAPARNNIPFLLVGRASELFADLLLRMTQVNAAAWRQWLIRFFQRPRFELQLSLPSNNQGGIVTAVLSKAGKLQDSFIKEFAMNEYPSIQKDLAYWVAHQIGKHTDS